MRIGPLGPFLFIAKITAHIMRREKLSEHKNVKS